MRETNYLKDNEKVLRILKDADKFSPFSSADIMSFLDHGKLLEYDQDEEIFNESRHEIFLYFIMSGGVRISRNGRELKTLRRTGEIFGDISHIKPSARPVTVTALQKTLVLRLDISKADADIDRKDLALGYTIYRIFCEVLTDKLRVCSTENEALKKQLATLTA
ncbi:MAG: cyclic nucleotide-binding domain-containing protein [Deltaproteobacteria bacterium]|nr:cyclic nucleotide-binding domain-containing protein [Deltaproteobacteria bacterium]